MEGACKAADIRASRLKKAMSGRFSKYGPECHVPMSSLTATPGCAGNGHGMRQPAGDRRRGDSAHGDGCLVVSR